MAFSIRSIFGKAQSRDGDPSGSTATLDKEAPPVSLPGENPFASSLLFKTVNPAEPLGQPVNATFQSPFTSAAAQPPGGLTVGDILPLLPTDVARASQIPPSQPLHLPDDVLQHALRTGQPAVSLFEVYRVCPAMFQTPISPQDPRQVQLPQHKIGHLLGQNGVAQTPPPLPIREALTPTAPPAGSPFSPAPVGSPGSSPFSGGPLDTTSPFSASPFSMSPQGPAPSSPFGAPAPMQLPENASPFTAAASPFGMPPAAGNGVSLNGPAAGAPPVAPSAGPTAASPFASPSSPTGESPFASPFGSANAPASPFGAPAPAPVEAAAPQGMPPAAFPSVPAEGGLGGFNPFSAAATATASVGAVPAMEPMASPFGQPMAAASSPTSSPFGMPAPAPAPEPLGSPFGAPSAPPAAAQSPFAPAQALPTAPVEMSMPAASPFGTPATPPLNASPFASFGTTPSAEPPASPFSATPAAPKAEPSPFASFGASPMTEPVAPMPAASPFGAPPSAPVQPEMLQASPTMEAPSLLGGSPFAQASAPSQPPMASPLGAPPAAGANAPAASPFGSSPFASPASGGSPFASPPADSPTSAGSSPFGASPFASPTQATPEPAPSPQPFGQPTAAPELPPVAQPASPSPFGSSPFGSSPFAGPAGPVSEIGASPFSMPTPGAPTAPEPASGPHPGASPFAMPMATSSIFDAPPPPAERPPEPPTKLMANPFDLGATQPSEPAAAMPPPVSIPTAHPAPGPISIESPFAAGGPSAASFPPAPSAYPAPAAEPTPAPPASTAQASMPLPFLKILSIAKSQSPAAAPLDAAAPAPYPFSHPAEKLESPLGMPLPSATSLLQPQSAPVTPPPVVVSPPTAPAPPAADALVDPNNIRLGLVAALKHCTAEEIGISPELIPAWIKVTLPIAAIEGQLATGRVRVPLSLIIDGLEAGYRSVLANARPGIDVQLPNTEVFHALPAGAAMPPALPAAESFGSPPSSDPFTAAALAAPPAVPRSEPQLANPFAPAASPPPQASPASAPLAPSNPVSVATRPAVKDPNRDILLRALLQASGDLDTNKVIALTARQQGVAAVVCLLDGREVCSSGNGSPDAEKFRSQASKLLSHVQPIIALTGIEGTETFSMKSDAHIVTFSFQGATTLCVLHDPGEADRGLPEKITLISREVSHMLADSPPFA